MFWNNCLSSNNVVSVSRSNWHLVLYVLTLVLLDLPWSHHHMFSPPWLPNFKKNKLQILSSEFPQILVIQFFTPSTLLASHFVRSPVPPPISRFDGLFSGSESMALATSLKFSLLDTLPRSRLSSHLPKPSAFLPCFSSLPLLSSFLF